jgi:hypothetical protein
MVNLLTQTVKNKKLWLGPRALRFKPEGCGFSSRLRQWNFLLTQSFQGYYGPEVDSVSNENEYQKYFLEGVKAAGALGWQPYHLHVPNVSKSGSLNLLESCGPAKGLCRNCFTIARSMEPSPSWQGNSSLPISVTQDHNLTLYFFKYQLKCYLPITV